MKHARGRRILEPTPPHSAGNTIVASKACRCHSCETLREADMDNVNGAVRAFIADPVLQKRLAKYLVQRCFRNSALEDLHAGTAPDSRAELRKQRWTRYFAN